MAAAGKGATRRRPRARGRLGLSIAIGLVAAAVAGPAGSWSVAPVVGWDAAAITWLLWVWLTAWPMSAADTKRSAGSEDPTRASSDLILLSAALASLAGVAVVLVLANSAKGWDKAGFAGLALVSVALAWAVVHSVFWLRYALLYYRNDPPGGISFNQDDPPAYADFAYLALTLGMTFQVSDTDLQTSVIRRTALRHALVSYLLGAVILATTINLIAGLGK
jgi:uncharacterized membrane protein